MVVIINLIIIDHSRMIQAFRFIEISKYDDGGQLTTRGQLMQGSSSVNATPNPGRYVAYFEAVPPPGTIRPTTCSANGTLATSNASNHHERKGY